MPVDGTTQPAQVAGMPEQSTPATRLPVPAELADYQLELGDGGNALTYTYDTRGERTAILPLLDRLSDAGIAFKDLQTTESSLEDIFVSLVKESA